jgi:hypothetical protein
LVVVLELWLPLLGEAGDLDRTFATDEAVGELRVMRAATVDRHLAQTRSRPYKKNDQATVESKNNHVVRKHAFHWRYDTPTELDLLNQL